MCIIRFITSVTTCPLKNSYDIGKTHEGPVVNETAYDFNTIGISYILVISNALLGIQK